MRIRAKHGDMRSLAIGVVALIPLLLVGVLARRGRFARHGSTERVSMTSVESTDTTTRGAEGSNL